MSLYTQVFQALEGQGTDGQPIGGLILRQRSNRLLAEQTIHPASLVTTLH